MNELDVQVDAPTVAPKTVPKTADPLEKNTLKSGLGSSSTAALPPPSGGPEKPSGPPALTDLEPRLVKVVDPVAFMTKDQYVSSVLKGVDDAKGFFNAAIAELNALETEIMAAGKLEAASGISDAADFAKTYAALYAEIQHAGGTQAKLNQPGERAKICDAVLNHVETAEKLLVGLTTTTISAEAKASLQKSIQRTRTYVDNWPNLSENAGGDNKADARMNINFLQTAQREKEILNQYGLLEGRGGDSEGTSRRTVAGAKGNAKTAEEAQTIAEDNGGFLVLAMKTYGLDAKAMKGLQKELDALDKKVMAGEFKTEEDAIASYRSAGSGEQSNNFKDRCEARASAQWKKYQDKLAREKALKAEKDRIAQEEANNAKAAEQIQKDFGVIDDLGSSFSGAVGKFIEAVVPNDGDSAKVALKAKIPFYAGVYMTIDASLKAGRDGGKNGSKVSFTADAALGLRAEVKVDLLLAELNAFVAAKLGGYVKAVTGSGKECIENFGRTIVDAVASCSTDLADMLMSKSRRDQIFRNLGKGEYVEKAWYTSLDAGMSFTSRSSLGDKGNKVGAETGIKYTSYTKEENPNGHLSPKEQRKKENFWGPDKKITSGNKVEKYIKLSFPVMGKSVSFKIKQIDDTKDGKSSTTYGMEGEVSFKIDDLAKIFTDGHYIIDLIDGVKKLVEKNQGNSLKAKDKVGSAISFLGSASAAGQLASQKFQKDLESATGAAKFKAKGNNTKYKAAVSFTQGPGKKHKLKLNMTRTSSVKFEAKVLELSFEKASKLFEFTHSG